MARERGRGAERGEHPHQAAQLCPAAVALDRIQPRGAEQCVGGAGEREPSQGLPRHQLAGRPCSLQKARERDGRECKRIAGPRKPRDHWDCRAIQPIHGHRLIAHRESVAQPPRIPPRDRPTMTSTVTFVMVALRSPGTAWMTIVASALGFPACGRLNRSF
jgi:hypothetical protein